MCRAVCFLVLAIGAAGCASEKQEKVRFYNEDGIYLFQRGEYQPARDSFLAAIALTPEDPALYYSVGECYDRMGEVANAERHYMECLGRDPGHADSRHALAVLLVREGRRDEAHDVGIIRDRRVADHRRAPGRSRRARRGRDHGRVIGHVEREAADPGCRGG